MRAAIPLPEGVVVATSIDGSLTGNGNVGSLVGIDAGRVVPASQTFPRGTYQGIELRLEGKVKGGAFLKNEVDMALQLNGSCVPGTLRDDHLSASLLGDKRDDSVDGLLVLCSRSCSLGTKKCDKELAFGNFWQLDALLDTLVLIVVPSCCKGASWQ